MTTSNEYWYVYLCRDDWGTKAAGYEPKAFATEELADAFAERELRARLGDRLTASPVLFKGDEIALKTGHAIHADTYEVKSFRLRKTAWNILVVEWDECERILSEESVHRIFDGVEIWDVHTQTAKGRSQAGAGCAFGVAVVHVKIDVLDALPAAEIAEAAE